MIKVIKVTGWGLCWDVSAEVAMYLGVSQSYPVAIRGHVPDQWLDEAILVHAADLHQLGAVVLTNLLCRGPVLRGSVGREVAVTARTKGGPRVRTGSLNGGHLYTGLCKYGRIDIKNNYVMQFKMHSCK